MPGMNVEQIPDENVGQETEDIEQLKAKLAELERAASKVSELEQELQQLKSSVPQEQPKQEQQGTPDVYGELAKLKLSQYLANDPYAAKYKDEIEAAIASVSPEYRISDFTIKSAIDYVKGKHVEEIVASVRKEPPPPVDGVSTAPEPPKPEPPKLDLTEDRKVILSAWFDGNTDAALSIVGGGTVE